MINNDKWLDSIPKTDLEYFAAYRDNLPEPHPRSRTDLFFRNFFE